MRFIFSVGLLAAFCLPGPANAASFDCAKAKTPIEKNICSDAVLGRADEELSRAYQKRSHDFPIPEFVKDSERVWLRSLPSCLPDVKACLATIRERIDQLNSWADPKVYTSYGKTFDHEGVTLVLVTRNGAPWLDWYGSWMPDAYHPRPFPDGFIAQESGALRKIGTKYTLADHDDASILISDEKITFEGNGMSLSARQGPISGDFLRVR
jgi:uncharacterized protein